MASDVAGCVACRQPTELFDDTMAFQPIVDVEANRIDAHEALVRGPGGEGAAAVLAQVTDANRYAFDQICRVKAIELAARLDLRGALNINFLPNAVYEPRACIRATLAAARRTGFPLDRLTFEFTEGERSAEERHLLAIVTEYRKFGFRIALDDFGTGYSGLSRLLLLRPDIIKLDRELVRDCDMSAARRVVVAKVAALVAELGLKLVAEGVERADEVTVLRACGVRFMQGFYFARPVFEGIAGDRDIHWPAPAQTAPAQP
jgi:EAL domain-containing protein (putative c-di-GMP-specific phosphodiesterase class I)